MKDRTINNNDDDISIDLVKEEAMKATREFELEVEENIKKISKFTRKNYDELLKLIFDDCGDLSLYEDYINTLEEKLIKFEDDKERLMYQKDITKRDIIDNSIFKLYGLYNINVIGSWISSSSIFEFIKKFIILSIIETSSFMINLNYFTSDKHKEEIDKRLFKIDEYIMINKYDIESFYKLREIYIRELKVEITKLFEIIELYNPNNKKNYGRMCELLKGLKLDFILDDSKVKAKIKRK